MNTVAKRCGVQFNPPSIILIYENEDSKQIRKRVIPVRSFSAGSDCRLAAERLKNSSRHRAYLERVSLGQLERLHTVLRDHMRGLSLEQSLASLRLDPDENLNKLDDEELNRKKAQMDELFERNRKRKDDPGFVYDLEVKFTEGPKEACSWDEESDDEF